MVRFLNPGWFLLAMASVIGFSKLVESAAGLPNVAGDYFCSQKNRSDGTICDVYGAMACRSNACVSICAMYGLEQCNCRKGTSRGPQADSTCYLCCGNWDRACELVPTEGINGNLRSTTRREFCFDECSINRAGRLCNLTASSNGVNRTGVCIGGQCKAPCDVLDSKECACPTSPSGVPFSWEGWCCSKWGNCVAASQAMISAFIDYLTENNHAPTYQNTVPFAVILHVSLYISWLLSIK